MPEIYDQDLKYRKIIEREEKKEIRLKKSRRLLIYGIILFFGVIAVIYLKSKFF